MANQVTIRMQVAVGFAAMAATIAMVGMPDAPSARAQTMAGTAPGCATTPTPVDPPEGAVRGCDA